MGLHIRVLGAEKSFRFLAGNRFDGIDIFASAVIAVIGNAFGVFIGQKISHRCLGIERTVILARDELQVASLVLELGHHAGGDFRAHGGDLVEVREIRDECGVDLVGRSGSKIRLEG